MSERRIALLKLSSVRAMLVAVLPLACAHAVEQEFVDDEDPNAPTGSGGSLIVNNAGMPGVSGKANTSGSGGSGVSNPFGGTSSTGGKTGSGGASAGSAGESEGGSAGKASGGTGGGSAGTSSSGAGGGGSGACGCTKTLAWADNTVLNWSTGECLTTGGKTYKYIGTKAQTWANKDCNPASQLVWCTDSGNDYKFMACP